MKFASFFIIDKLALQNFFSWFIQFIGLGLCFTEQMSQVL